MRSPGFFGKKGRETGGPSRVPPPHKPPPQIPWCFGGMAPAAARRARPVQRSGHQGLQGNPDACHPRRGSACDMSARKTSGNARLVFALSVQPTAAMSPRTGGSRVGEAPRPFFPPISSGRKARRVVAPHERSPRRPAGDHRSPLHRRPKLRIVRFRVNAKAHSLRWASFSPRRPLRWVAAGAPLGAPGRRAPRAGGSGGKRADTIRPYELVG